MQRPSSQSSGLPSLSPGIQVRRGPHWPWGDRYGGIDIIGVVQSEDKSDPNVPLFWVQWPNGKVVKLPYARAIQHIEIASGAAQPGRSSASSSSASFTPSDQLLSQTMQLDRRERELVEDVKDLEADKAQLKRELAASRAREQELLQHMEDMKNAFTEDKERLETQMLEQESALDSICLQLQFAPDSLESCQRIAAEARNNSLETLRLTYAPTSSSCMSVADSGIVLNWAALKPFKEIAEGGIGSVFACKFLASESKQPIVAIKAPSVLVKERMFSSSRSAAPSSKKPTAPEVLAQQSLHNEIDILRNLKHPNIVRFLGVTMAPSLPQFICVAQQYCAAGDLSKFIKAKHPRGVPELLTFQIAFQIASGIKELHKMGVIHRDLKPANVVLASFSSLASGMPIAKITDCGSASLHHANEERSNPIGAAAAGAGSGNTVTSVDAFTSRYSSPELLKIGEDWKKSYAQDIWAFGIILYELCSGRVPYASIADERQVIVAVSQAADIGEFPRAVVEAEEEDAPWHWLRVIVQQCLLPDAVARLQQFSKMGGKPDGRDAFEIIEAQLAHFRPQWAQDTLATVHKFERMEIRDPFLTSQTL